MLQRCCVYLVASLMNGEKRACGRIRRSRRTALRCSSDCRASTKTVTCGASTLLRSAPLREGPTLTGPTAASGVTPVSPSGITHLTRETHTCKARLQCQDIERPGAGYGQYRATRARAPQHRSIPARTPDMLLLW